MHRPRVFHRGGHEVAVAVGEIARPGIGPLVHFRPVPEGAGGKRLPSSHEGRLQRIGKADEPGARRAQGVRVSQAHVLSQPIGPADERGVERIDLAIGPVSRRFVGLGLPERNIAGGPSIRNLARIDLEGKVAVHDVIRPDRRAHGNVRRIAAGNASHNPIGVREIETWVQSESHDRRRSFSRTHASIQCQYSVLIEAEMAVAGR